MGPARDTGAVGILIEVDQLSVTVDGAELLGQTTVSVNAGESLAVTGANGTGKTTLLRVLAGDLRQTSGTVRIGGRFVDERSPQFRRGVSASIGRPPVARDLTLEEHLTLVAVSWGQSRQDAGGLVQQHLGRWQLLPLRRRWPHELSSGQSQLFALALATVRPFDVLLLDEPEQRLDPDRLQAVIAALGEEQANGATIVFATHSPLLAEALAGTSIALAGATA